MGCTNVANPAPHQGLRRDTLIFKCKPNWSKTANVATILRPFLVVKPLIVQWVTNEAASSAPHPFRMNLVSAEREGDSEQPLAIGQELKKVGAGFDPHRRPPKNAVLRDRGGAKSGALDADDPRLARLMEGCPRLPEAI